MFASPRALTALGLLLLAAVPGCGEGHAAPTRVRGRVLYQGRPLSQGTIVFTPDADRGGRGACAVGTIGGDA